MSLHINSWGDLKQFGINTLTGEACAFSMRVLCDLSATGADNIRAFFGLPAREDVREQFQGNWNSSVCVGDTCEPAVASIMLPRGIYDDLCRFMIFLKSYDYAVHTKDGAWRGG